MDRMLGDAREFQAQMAMAACLNRLGKPDQALRVLEGIEPNLRRRYDAEPIFAHRFRYLEQTHMSWARTEALLALNRIHPSAGFASQAFAYLDADRGGWRTRSSASSIEQAQASLDEDTALAQFFVADITTRRSGTGTAMVYLKNEFKTADLGSMMQIPDMVFRLVAGIRNRAQVTSIASELSRTLLGRLRLPRGIKRLVIVPGGLLEFIPWSALPDPDRPEQLLVDRMAIIIAPSVYEIIERHREKAASRHLAIVSDPVFRSSDPRLTHYASIVIDPVVEAATRSAGLGQAAPRRLVHSRFEAQRIARYTTDVQSWSGFAATRELVMGGVLRDFRIIHFATHGLGSPMRTSESASSFDCELIHHLRISLMPSSLS